MVFFSLLIPGLYCFLLTDSSPSVSEAHLVSVLRAGQSGTRVLCTRWCEGHKHWSLMEVVVFYVLFCWSTAHSWHKYNLYNSPLQAPGCVHTLWDSEDKPSAFVPSVLSQQQHLPFLLSRWHVKNNKTLKKCQKNSLKLFKDKHARSAQHVCSDPFQKSEVETASCKDTFRLDIAFKYILNTLTDNIRDFLQNIAQAKQHVVSYFAGKLLVLKPSRLKSTINQDVSI